MHRWAGSRANGSGSKTDHGQRPHHGLPVPRVLLSKQDRKEGLRGHSAGSDNSSDEIIEQERTPVEGMSPQEAADRWSQQHKYRSDQRPQQPKRHRAHCTQSKNKSNKLGFFGVPQGIGIEDLTRWTSVAPIAGNMVVADKSKRADKGNHLNYGFCYYTMPQVAAAVIKNFHGKQLNGATIAKRYGNPEDYRYKKVLIGNIPREATDLEVRQLVYGLYPIYIRIKKCTKQRGRYRTAVSGFEDYADTNRATRLIDGKLFKGKVLSAIHD